MAVRRGRPLSLPASNPVALALRRQREALGLTLRGLAQRAGVTQHLIVDFEHGRKTPSPEQFSRLRSVLGIEELPDCNTPFSEVDLVTLSACLASTQGLPITIVARVLRLSAAEVREGVTHVRDRFAAIGFDLFIDSHRIRTTPSSWCRVAIREATEIPELTTEEFNLLGKLHRTGGTRVADLEAALGATVRTSLAALYERGLVTCVAAGRIAERRYWVTEFGLMRAAHWALQRAAE